MGLSAFGDIGLVADAKHQCVSVCCEIELSILDRIFTFVLYSYLLCFFVLIKGLRKY